MLERLSKNIRNLFAVAILASGWLFGIQIVSGQTLSKIYRGDDGSALYLRITDNKIFGFGEHSGKKYAFVLSGTRNNDRLTARFLDVPKGTRRESGNIELQLSQNNERLTRKSGSVAIGSSVWEEIPAGSFSWPTRQEAGFQVTNLNDLDGVFTGDDGSRYYMRELPEGEVVWVAEADFQPDTRPSWVSVFVGKRSANNVFSGDFADVPKGTSAVKGRFGASLIGTERNLVLQQNGVNRSKKLEPRYALDWDKFADSIREALEGNTVGFSYAIGRDGSILRSGAGGFRRLKQDGKRESFTVDTLGQAASTTKTITAVMLVKALNDRKFSVDTKIASFLPDCWEKGPGVNSLTFRELLDHKSGLSEPSCREDPYGCLVKIIKTGVTREKEKNYNNTAFALMRYLVPLVAEETKANGQFRLFDCKNPNDELNKDISTMFNRYMFDKILTPAGATASFFPSSNYALNYNFEDLSLNGVGPRADFGRRGGAGYLAISAPDFVKFIGALNRGDILPKSVVRSMYDGNLGFDSPSDGVTGRYFTKNGGCPDLEDKGRGCGAQVMVYPGGIQAYLMVNSGSNDLDQKLRTVLRKAFDESLK